MTDLNRPLIWGGRYDNVTYYLGQLDRLYHARKDSGDDSFDLWTSCWCYKEISFAHTHFGYSAIGNELVQAIATRAARTLALAAQEIRSSMPETFVGAVTNIIVSYI